MAIALYVSEYEHQIETGHTLDLAIGSLISAGILLLETVGAAAIAVGILNITIETDDWRRYFEERLRGVVTYSSYLRTLDLEELRKILNEVLKSHFRDEQIDREGGFLKFFYKHLLQFIGTPYRENLHLTIDVSPADNESQWQVSDQARYICRKVCGSIQSSVQWASDFEEELVTLKIEVIHPEGSNKESGRELIANLNEEELTKIKTEQCANTSGGKAIKYKFTYPLEKI
jgi:hypothetical protein